MDVNEMYEIAQYLINKNQGAYLSPDEFNLLINQSATSFLDYLLGEFSKYQYGRAQPIVQYSENEIVRQRLTPFIYGYNLAVSNTGYSAYPDDYQQEDAMWTIYGFQRIKYVQQDKLASAINSRIDPVATNPIYLIKDDGFQLYPITIGSAKLSYVRTPDKIYWAYTLDANGLPVYDPVHSIQPLWYITDLYDILARLLRMVGVSIQANEVSQYATEIKNSGQ